MDDEKEILRNAFVIWSFVIGHSVICHFPSTAANPSNSDPPPMPRIPLLVAHLYRCHRELPKIQPQIALEITAGQGTCLGHTFEQLAFILENAREPERLSVCLDTAHLFAAGYDISTTAGAKKTFAAFDKIV